MNLDQINQLTGGRLGTFDVACPVCGSEKRSPANRTRKVLRVWRLEPGFATYHCARCGGRGHSRDSTAPAPDPNQLARARAAAEQRERVAVVERLDKARWLWSQCRPIAGTVAERYLRQARGYNGPLPGTLGVLAGRGDHPPAMIAGFGIPGEPEPGRLELAEAALVGVHITRLAPDGAGKAGTERDKIMIGRSIGAPLVLAPCNDLLGLAIAEGIEDALSVHEATGLGAWAAGSASRLPALAVAVPAYVECITIMVDDDPDGRQYAAQLDGALDRRGIEVRRILLPKSERTAA